MHGSLDVGAVEVSFVACGEVGEFGGEAEDVPEKWALLVDFVNIEARIDFESSIVNGVEDVAGGVIDSECWLHTGWRECKVLFTVSSIAAGLI